MSYADWFCCLAVLFIWSSSSALVSAFVDAGNPLIVSGMVVTISLLIFSLVLFNKNNRKILKTIELKELYKLIIPALLGIYLYPIVYFTGISGSSPIKANILNYMWPLIAYIMSIVFNKRKKNKRIRFKEIISICLAMLGAYIVMCFNENTLFSFNKEDIGYILVAFLGAVFYGVYTAMIDVYSPKIARENFNEKTNLPPHLRMLIMLFIAEILHILLFIIMIIINPENTTITITSVFDKERILPFCIYSILNYSLAHFLWNKVNTQKNIHITVNTAFYIPFISTIILSYTTNREIGLYSTIGLILIVLSTIINNLQYINSINATLVGALIMFSFIGISPLAKDDIVNQNAKYFLEIIIALYSIYYGFLLNRVVTEYRQFEENIYKTLLLKNHLSEEDKRSITELEKIYLCNEKTAKQNSAKQEDFFQRIKNINSSDSIIEQYSLIYRYRGYALSLSEWIIVILLSVLIVVLCFFVRDSSLLSSCVVMAIGSSICLCVSSLYDYERKKRQLLKILLNSDSLETEHKVKALNNA